MTSNNSQIEASNPSSLYEFIFKLIKLVSEKPKSHILVMLVSIVLIIIIHILSAGSLSIEKDASFYEKMQAIIVIATQILLLVVAVLTAFAHWRDNIRIDKKSKKWKRYLGNKSTKQVHDLINQKPQCQISEIKEIKYFDSLTEAYAEGYDKCDHCIV
jgi:uncharacterized membrane protein